jgi:hypothetical protein
MPSLYACADVLMLHLCANPLFAITVPLLIGGEGDSVSLVTESCSGISCPPGDPAALASAAVKLHAMSPEERQTTTAVRLHVSPITICF